MKTSDIDNVTGLLHRLDSAVHVRDEFRAAKDRGANEVRCHARLGGSNMGRGVEIEVKPVAIDVAVQEAEAEVLRLVASLRAIGVEAG